MIILSKLKVEEVCNLTPDALLIVRPDAEVGEIIQQFADRSDLRGIFVADETGHLQGVVTRTDLLDWARVRLGASLYPPYRDLEKTLRLASMIRASTAAEIMHPGSGRAAVQAHETLNVALRRMIEMDLILLPVVDTENRIIGEINLSCILAAGHR